MPVPPAGTKRPPRLELQQSWWAMSGLGNGLREWTIEEKFERIAEGGFTGILGRLPERREREAWKRLLDAYGFSFGIHSFPAAREELAELLQEAADFGSVLYVNSQVADAFVVNGQATALLAGLTEEARSRNMPYYVETHRGRVTQDLLRTVDYVRAVPELRLTIDLSHYVLAGERMERSSAMEAAFGELLQRTSSIHARVSNGQQIQVDIGPGGEHPLVEDYMRWWEQGIRAWLKQAGPEAALPFVCELGPPPYSIVGRYDARVEATDRWEQALVFRSLAEQAWKRAHSAG